MRGLVGSFASESAAYSTAEHTQAFSAQARNFEVFNPIVYKAWTPSQVSDGSTPNKAVWTPRAVNKDTNKYINKYI